MKKNFLILTSLCVFLSNILADDTLETVDDIITWGAGISGATSLLICSKTKGTNPIPISFYTFNSAMVGYWALDLLISDNNSEESNTIITNNVNGDNDEQYNSYVRARDLAKENKKSAKNKGKYKKATSLIMIASAALALSENNRFMALEKSGLNTLEINCREAVASNNGTLASLTLENIICKNIGGAKISCQDEEREKISAQKTKCLKLANYIKTSPSNGCAVLRSNIKNITTSSDNQQDKILDLSTLPTESSQIDVKNNSITGKKIDLTNNPITNVLTFGGLQFHPKTRAITYTALGAIVAINSFTNNSAANKYEEEEMYYQELIDRIDNCNENCHNIDSNQDTPNNEESDYDYDFDDTKTGMHHYNANAWNGKGLAIVLMPGVRHRSCKISTDSKSQNLVSHGSKDKGRYIFTLYTTTGREFDNSCSSGKISCSSPDAEYNLPNICQNVGM